MRDLTDDEIEGVTDIRSAVFLINRKLEEADLVLAGINRADDEDKKFASKIAAISKTYLVALEQKHQAAIKNLDTEKASIFANIDAAAAAAIADIKETYNVRKDLITAAFAGATGALPLLLAVLFILMTHTK